MQTKLEQVVALAVGGSRDALEDMVRRIQDQVYWLSLRMMFHPMDAEDATQEILVKVITNLKGFRSEGPFEAWVYRIAANHLKSVRIRRTEGLDVDLEKAQTRIDQAQARGWFSQPLGAPAPLLELEMRSACTQALLMAMDRAHRLAFILGAVMDVSSQEGAYILGITPAAFRKRLSRSRQRITDFLKTNCGLFGQSNPCHCPGLGAGYVRRGWMNPQKPLFVSDPNQVQDNITLQDYMKELDDLGKMSAMFHAFPETGSPTDFAAQVKGIVDSGQYRILEQPQLH